jgi:hypothetical protein
MTQNTLKQDVGPFRSELAARMYRETFMIAQRIHSVSLSAVVSQGGEGWYVATEREPIVR